MKANVDKDVCIGCGLCPSICPEVFDMDDDGKAKAVVSEVASAAQDETREAADSCPVGAISVD